MEVKSSNTYITREKYEESPEIQVNNNDILFVKTGSTLGKSALVSGLMEPATINPQIVIIRSQRKWIQFLSVLLMTSCIQKQITAAKIGGAVPTLTESEIKKFKFYIPNDLNETGKIGQFFSKIDSLIALYERKFKLLSQVKKYFLNNLFTKKEYPNLRFKGYEDTWLKSKFSKFLSIPEKVKVTIDSPSRILTVKLNLGGVQKGANRTTLKLNSTTYYLRKAGQLIYGKQNLFNGSLAIIPSQFEGYVTSGDVPSLNINNINKQFLYYYIARRSFYKKTEAYSSGTGSKRIHEKTFLSFNIVYPENLKEQEKISRLISSINSNIKLYCSKKNKLTAIKKKLLNTMFI